MRRGGLLFTVAALAACLLSAPGRAAGAGPLLAVLPLRPPWAMIADGAPSGADVDILRLVAGRLGLDLELRTDTRQRCLSMLKKGQADLMAGLVFDPERAQPQDAWLTYVTPPYATRESKAFYATRDRAQSIERYEFLRLYRVGTVRGQGYFPQFDLDDELRKSPRDTLAESMRRLTSGAVGIVVADEAEADWWLRANPEVAGHVAKTPLNYQGYHPLHFAFSDKSPAAALAGEFGSALAALLREGAIADILTRYGIRP